jgi:fatty-acyl-CoA synthase
MGHRLRGFAPVRKAELTVRRPKSKHLADLLEEMAAEVPDHEFVVFGETRVTYGAFEQRVSTVARGLYALGVRPGSRVALLVSNCIEWLEVSFASHQLGATVAPLSTFYRSWDLDYTLRQSDAELLITLPSFRGNSYLEFLEELGRDTFPSLKQVVVVAASAPPGFMTYAEMLERGTAVSDEEIAACRVQVTARDLAYILYTSGTTARPKGVMVEHLGICENGWSMGERLHVTPDDRIWVVVPLAWGLGSENAVPVTLTHRATVVLQEHFDAGAALELFERERVSVLYVMPNMTLALVDHPSHASRDLSSLRTGITLGTREELRRAIEDVPVPQINNAYGATENYGNTCLTDCDMDAETRMTSQGKPLPGMIIKVVDPDTGEPVEPGRPGELLVGGYVVPGYWGDPERTREAFPDGLYRTGDLAYFDEHGNMHYVARIKDMIKSGGINVAPAEVEDFLATHPLIKEAYVLGASDPEKGEVLMACVQVSPGAELAESELVAWCRARIASYKIPQRWRFISESDVPRTSTGKVNKVDLQRFLAERHLA